MGTRKVTVGCRVGAYGEGVEYLVKAGVKFVRVYRFIARVILS